MKKLFCVFALMLFATSCKDEVHITVYEDMIYFLSAESEAGYLEPITNLTEEAPVRLNLYVSRSLFAANDYPKQDVRILVEEETTADPNMDFTLAMQQLRRLGDDLLNPTILHIATADNEQNNQYGRKLTHNPSLALRIYKKTEFSPNGMSGI